MPPLPSTITCELEGIDLTVNAIFKVTCLLFSPPSEGSNMQRVMCLYVLPSLAGFFYVLASSAFQIAPRRRPATPILRMDSDSDISTDFTQTSVLLGYASKEPTEDTFSQLGGHPGWLDEKTAPPGAFAKCKVCNGLLSLLLQLNGDLPEHFPGHERRLYLFSCQRKTCQKKNGSVRGFRATRITKTAAKPAKVQTNAGKEPSKPQVDIGGTLFGTNASNTSTSTNPFSTSSSITARLNPFSSAPSTASPPPNTTKPDLSETFAAKVRVSDSSPTSNATAIPPQPQEPWPPQASFPPAYPRYHLDAAYEELDVIPLPVSQPARVDMDIDGGEASGSASGSAVDDKDAFESSLDKTLLKFQDTLAQNGEQILRYEFGGTPLLYSKTDVVGKLLAGATGGDANSKVKVAGKGDGSGGIPRCENCGAERVFELQLVPHAIMELESGNLESMTKESSSGKKAKEALLEGMEWGTIILGVCSKGCQARGVTDGEVGYLEEWVGVQWEDMGGK